MKTPRFQLKGKPPQSEASFQGQVRQYLERKHKCDVWRFSTPGCPDYEVVPPARPNFYIEIKKDKDSPDDHQAEVKRLLERKGYTYLVIWPKMETWQMLLDSYCVV